MIEDRTTYQRLLDEIINEPEWKDTMTALVEILDRMEPKDRRENILKFSQLIAGGTKQFCMMPITLEKYIRKSIQK